ncbi:MAG: hypothetical protein B6I38_00460 [Anaerolineaceae bacterium 4572_5.1]|nr:MAG: hypothetical protein B6I38_00460 [Anaerolineaceae bacterium 4572_5.1]
MKSGRVLVLLLLLIGALGSLVTSAPIYMRLLYLGSLIIIGSWLWAKLAISGLKLTRRSRSLRANVGDIYDEYFEVDNDNRWPCPWIEVLNETSLPAAAGSRLLVGIGRRQKRSYLARTWLTQRGSFSLGPTTLMSGDPLGLFQISKNFPAENEVIVLPLLVEVTSFPSPPGMLPGGKVVRRKALGVTPHAASVREYAPGDALRRIHWPTTVRRQQLMVKEFDQDPQAEVWIFLDAQTQVQASLVDEDASARWDGWMLGKRPDFELPPSTLEYGITIAASLAHYFIRQRRAVGLVVAGQMNIAIPADRSVRQEAKILETLAFVQASRKLSLESLVRAQAGQLPQGSSAVLITSSVRPEIIIAIDELQRRHLHPTVILLDAASFGGQKGSAELAESLINANVPVCHIACEADLGVTLSTFAKNTVYQETTKWFEPSIL